MDNSIREDEPLPRPVGSQWMAPSQMVNPLFRPVGSQWMAPSQMVNPLPRPVGSQWMAPSEKMNPLLGKSSEAVLSASFLSLQLFPGSQSTVQSDRDSGLITISRACLPTWHMLFPSSGILLLHLQSCALFVFTFVILYLCSFFNLAHPLYSKQ